MLTKTDTPTAEIEIRDLIKRYHAQAVLDRLSLTIEDGAFCVLVGANGAGKTTLLRILAGLSRSNGGLIRMGGFTISSDPQVRRKIGYVGHQSMFYQDLTPAENLRHYARLYQLSNSDEKITVMLHTAGLIQHQHKPVRVFSRGMQQRLSIARALLHDPDILLFDEPYTGLDQEAAGYLDGILRNLHVPGKTILLAAHRPQRLIPIASHIAWLNQGKISHHIPVSQLSDFPNLQEYLRETA